MESHEANEYIVVKEWYKIYTIIILFTSNYIKIYLWVNNFYYNKEIISW